MKHVCIVGAGIAGACAAAALAPQYRVTLLDAASPAAGASGVAAGIVNPFMARKAHPVWRREEALDALAALLKNAGLDVPAPGLCKPAASEEQGVLFASRAGQHPAALHWFDSAGAAARWPLLDAPHGLLWVHEGMAVDVGHFARRLVACALRAGATVRFGEAGTLLSLHETRDGVRLHPDDGADLSADFVLLCLGEAHPHFDTSVALHPVKGQVITLFAPQIAPLLPLVSATGYLVPEGETIRVGSTFEHTFEHLHPTADGIAYLRAQATALVPGLRDAPVVDAQAGVRMTVPRSRLSVIGPLPARPRTWIFNGLAARGLLTAPLLATLLPGFLENPQMLPEVLRPRPASATPSRQVETP